MNPLLAVPADFASLIQRFFGDRLIQQQNASPRTVAAYRDSFRLLLGYAARERGKQPEQMALGDFDAGLVLDFLAHLETERHNTVRSRNARLAAVRAFAHYVALQFPPALQLAQQILAIPMKRFERPMLGFLSRDEVQALLVTPDPETWCGRRDRVMFALLYNTGARVSEMIGIRVADVTLAATSSVRLHGKGRKQRTVPLWKETAAEVRDWLKYAGLRADQPIVPNRSGLPMTRTNVADRLTLAIATATKQYPQLAGRTISPHSLRHYLPFLTMSCVMDEPARAFSNCLSWPVHADPITRHSPTLQTVQEVEEFVSRLVAPLLALGR